LVCAGWGAEEASVQAIMRLARREFARHQDAIDIAIARDALWRVLAPRMRDRISNAWAARAGAAPLSTLAIVAGDASAPLQALVRLAAQASLAILERAEMVASREFWRERASAVSAEFAAAEARQTAQRAASEAEMVQLQARHRDAMLTARAEIERLQQLVRELALGSFNAVEDERRRIARDLHDEQAQLLAAARIALKAAPAQVPQILKELDTALRKCVRELRPAALGRLDLAAGLRIEIERLADAGIKTSFTGQRVIAQLSRPVQELCYKITREAVSNILRHSGARRVELDLALSDDEAVLRINDDGRGGFDSSARRTAPGIGLAGMAERLELMGGSLKLERAGDKTQLIARVPHF